MNSFRTIQWGVYQQKMFWKNYFYANNGGVFTVREKNGIYSGPMKALTAKLSRLKYRQPLACLDEDIQFFRYLPLMIAGHNRKFYLNFCLFFRDGWTELVELY